MLTLQIVLSFMASHGRRRLPSLAGLLTAALLLAALPPSRAAELVGLYEAEVPVASREEAERQSALGDALRQVLVKVTGQRSPERNPVAAGALREPGAAVQQFRYRVVELPALGPDLPASQELRLVAQFDPTVVGRILREAGLPRWGRTRPATVVWVALEDRGERELLGADDPASRGAALEAAAAARGVPVVVPLLDLEDRAALDVADVWSGSRGPIDQASLRYGNESVLVGRVYRVLPTRWEGRWTLLLGGGESVWSASGESLEAVLAGAMGKAADTLAARYAGPVTSGGATAVELVVSGVATLEDYARTLRYLGTLDGVDRVGVRRAEGDRLTLAAEARMGRERLRSVLGLGRVLELDSTASDTGALALRLLP